MESTKSRLLNDAEKSVLLVHLAKYYGGSSVRVLQMARMLNSKRDFAVVVLDNSPLHLKLIQENLPFISINYKRGDPRIIFELKNIIHQHQFLVIDTHNPQSHLWGLIAAKLAGVEKIISTIHGCYGDAESGWRSFLYNFVLRLNSFGNSRFIAVSDSVVDYLRRLAINEKKIHLITNAVSVTTKSKDNTIINDEAGWSSQSIIIVIAARLEPVKGIKYLIKAFAQARKKNNQLKLCVIGEGRERTALEQQVAALNLKDHVLFTGFRNDVISLLNSADIFCLPSLSEGLPYAVMEAALCCLPLALSEVGGMAEMFQQNKTALFFPPKNINKLSNVLMLLAEKPALRRRLAESAYHMVDQLFSPDAMYKKVISVYDG